MTKGKNFRLDFWFLTIAILFLADPIIAFKDLLPDVIGYALLLFGLSHLSDLSEGVSECRRRIRVLLILGVLQLLAGLLVQVYMPAHIQEMNKYELPVTILLCTLLAALIRLFLLIPIFRNLFSELERLCSFTKGTALLRERKGKTIVQTAKNICMVCVVLSSVCSLLPELAVLTSFEAVATDPLLEFEWYQASMGRTAVTNTWFDWFPYVGTFRTVTALLSLIAGCILAVAYIRCFLRMIKDREWIGNLEQEYAKSVIPQHGLFAVRRIRTSFGLLFVGSCFLLSFRLGHYPVFPTVFLTTFVMIALITMAPMLTKGKKALFASIPSLLISGTSLILILRYLKDHVPKDSLYLENAYWQFLTLQVLAIAEAACVCMLLFVLYRVLNTLLHENTGIEYENDESLSQKATDKLHRGLMRKMKIAFLLLMLSTLANAVDVYFQAIYTWLWIPTNALTVVAIICFYSFLKELFEQICFYYRSDGVNSNRI